MIRPLLILFVTALSFSIIGQSKIIFSRSPGKLNTGGTPDLMIYDGTSKTTSLLYRGSVRRRGEYSAAVSPDGSKLIVNTYQFGGWKLGIADIKNGSVTNMKKFTSRSNYEYSPSWSHDGNSVAYQEYNWGTDEMGIFIADKNGRNVSRLTNFRGGDRTACWTNDDQSIVFSSSRKDNYEIFIKSLEDQSIKNLTQHSSTDFAPSTSSTNNKIAFLSDRGGTINLYVMNYDGTELRKLTESQTSDKVQFQGFQTSGYWAYQTSWSPEGDKIVFTNIVNDNIELFIVGADGSSLIQITNNNDSDFCPFWYK